MNEFIFWDKVAQKFYDNEKSFYDDNENYKCALVGGEVLVHHYYNEYEEDLINPYKENNMIIPLSYIGLKDTDNDKIYADSSIVEFKLIINPVCRTVVINRKGVFKYDKDLCAYIIECIDEDRILIFSNSFKYIKNIKIIDTIQENKLGLIKDKE